MRVLSSAVAGTGVVRQVLKGIVLAVPVAAGIGSVVAFFLWALDRVTELRWHHTWLLLLLPAAGLLVHILYRLWGGNAERGANLILEEIHQPGGGVPARMAPLVLLATLITHLVGGSAGREGTAVQIGGSLAAWTARRLRLQAQDVRRLLLCGVAAGFGAVFGTPVTGAVFALEVLAVGQVRYEALLPCLVASVVADGVCAAWGIRHTAYHVAALPDGSGSLDGRLLVTVAGAGIAFGLASRLFVHAVHRVKHATARYIRPGWLIPVAGGALLLAAAAGAHKMDYLGLGVTAPTAGGVSIVRAFQPGGSEPLSWLWKLLFTAWTLGCGFKGGEVTPLFFIGATLGNTLAGCTGAPVDLMAGLGFIAVFAGAANTPLACTLLGAELFGSENLVYYALACVMAYCFSGATGIYSAQLPAGSRASDQDRF